MKHIACSRIWKDVKIFPTKKEINNCCKRVGYSPSIDEVEKQGSKIFTSNPAFISEKEKIVATNALTSACGDCIKHWPNSDWDVMNDWKTREWQERELLELPYQELTQNIEIKLSSTCNMSCIYCDEFSSSTWGKLKNVEIDENTEWTKLVLEKLYDFIGEILDRPLTFTFLGGEPFLDLNIFDVIERLLSILNESDHRHKIKFTTNLNVKPKVIQNFLNIIQKYNNVDWIICASIDAVGTAGIEIRDGLRWELFEQNVITLLESPSIYKFDFQPSMNSLNIPYFKEYLEWIVKLVENTRKLENIDKTWTITSNTVTYPRAMYPGLLPYHYKKHIKECLIYLESLGLKTSFQYLALEQLLNVIGNSRNPRMIAQIKPFFDHQSKIKNKNYYEIFPHINEMIKKE
jgi:hypothetical protein